MSRVYVFVARPDAAKNCVSGVSGVENGTIPEHKMPPSSRRLTQLTLLTPFRGSFSSAAHRGNFPLGRSS